MSRLFTDVLRDINAGQLVEELTTEVADLVAAAHSTRKFGELTLKLKFKPGKGNSDVMTVEHDIKVKSPNFDRPPTYMFVSRGNTLTITNPQQGEMKLMEVPRPAMAVADPPKPVAAAS